MSGCRSAVGWLACAAFLAAGCVTESVRTRTVAERPIGRFTGPALSHAAPRIHVVLHTGGDKLFAESMLMGKCATLDVIEQHRVQEAKSRVGVFPIVMAALASGVATAVFVHPDADAQGSALGGAAILATGAIILGVSKGLESDSERSLPPRPAQQVGPAIACVLRPIATERITLQTPSNVLTADTDPWGRAAFSENVPGPYRVLVGTLAADVVEVRR
jgi:hypothetical protein